MGSVYRIWGRDGTLLYVGSTTRPPGERVAEHAREKPWWGEVGRWDAQPVADRVLLRVEAAAIRSQRPRYNITHNGRNPHRVRVTSVRRPVVVQRWRRRGPERRSRRYGAPVTPSVWWPALLVVAGLVSLGCGTGVWVAGGFVLAGFGLLGCAVQIVRRGRVTR